MAVVMRALVDVGSYTAAPLNDHLAGCMVMSAARVLPQIPVGHVLPHMPQLSGSDVGSTHPAPHQIFPPAQTSGTTSAACGASSAEPESCGGGTLVSGSATDESRMSAIASAATSSPASPASPSAV